MSKIKKYNWRAIVGIVVSVAAIIFVYMQWDTIKKSIEALQRADWLYVCLAIVVYTFTVLAAAAVIYNLRLVQKLRYINLLLVQTATLFLGRITPASVGGLAAMARVLFTQGHTVVQSGTVVAASGIATFFGNILLAGIALLLSFQTAQLSELKVPIFILYISVAAVIIVAVLLCIKNIRSRVQKILHDVLDTLRTYTHRKKSIALAVLFGAIVTFCFALTLMLVAKSLGVNISLFAAIVTVSLGSLGVAVTPLPGGVVGAEAALAATLTQFGVTADVALAIAFVYRFVIFWLPLVPGYIASQYSLKKELL